MFGQCGPPESLCVERVVIQFLRFFVLFFLLVGELSACEILSTMKKNYLYLLPFLSIMLCLVSCYEPFQTQSLVGRWEDSGSAYVFNSNKTGVKYYKESLYGYYEYWKTEYDFTWTNSNNQLFMTITTDGYDSSPKMYYYDIVDDYLNIYLSDWGHFETLRKVQQ